MDNFVFFSGILLGVGIILLGFSKILVLSMLSSAMTGFAMVVHMASCNTLLQTIADEHMRRRVMSFLTMAFMGMLPIGSLCAGILANHIGVSTTLMMGGALCICGSLIFSCTLPHLKARLRVIQLDEIELKDGHV